MKALLLALGLLTTAALQAADTVWCAVLLASHAKQGESPTAHPDIARYAPKMTEVFGYDCFELLGMAKKQIDDKEERWLVPVRDMELGTLARKEGAGYRLQLEFVVSKKRVLKAEAQLGPRSPLFLNGPKSERGRVLVIFEVQP